MNKKYDVGEMTALFKTEVSDRSSDIDPDCRYCWLSLAVGWAVAKGMPPDDAVKFAAHIRYDTDLG